MNDWVLTTKEWFTENLYPLDMVTAPGGITFKDGESTHIFCLRNSRTPIAKIVSDMRFGMPSKYYGKRKIGETL